jgi:hypothetical protein
MTTVTSTADTTRLCKLLEKWTRAEIASRVGAGASRCGADFYMEKIRLEDRIRCLLYGTDDLVELAKRFEIPLC